MAKATSETPAKEKSSKKVEEKVPEKKYITTRQVADEMGIKPASLRRYLRTLPSFTGDGYTRYKWDPENKQDMRQIEDVKEGFEKFNESEKKKNSERLAKLKEGKAETKKGTAKATKKAKDEDDEEEEEEEL